MIEGLQLALEMDGIAADYVEMGDEFAYWRLLRGLWEAGEGFVVVEHDVLPWPGALRQLWDCPEMWCAFPYRLSHDPGFSTALGCTKFSAKLLERTPGAMDVLAEGRYGHSVGDRRHWWGLDGRLSLVLTNLVGLGWPHRHEPPVSHLNERRFGHG